MLTAVPHLFILLINTIYFRAGQDPLAKPGKYFQRFAASIWPLLVDKFIVFPKVVNHRQN
jgi:hypothetical protein